MRTRRTVCCELHLVVDDLACQPLNIGNSDGSSIGTTGPINPQSTAQVTVDFRDPGTYTVSAGKSGKTQAEQHQPSSIASAALRIGQQRASASSQLLQP